MEMAHKPQFTGEYLSSSLDSHRNCRHYKVFKDGEYFPVFHINDFDESHGIVNPYLPHTASNVHDDAPDDHSRPNIGLLRNIQEENRKDYFLSGEPLGVPMAVVHGMRQYYNYDDYNLLIKNMTLMLIQIILQEWAIIYELAFWNESEFIEKPSSSVHLMVLNYVITIFLSWQQGHNNFILVAETITLAWTLYQLARQRRGPFQRKVKNNRPFHNLVEKCFKMEETRLEVTLPTEKYQNKYITLMFSVFCPLMFLTDAFVFRGIIFNNPTTWALLVSLHLISLYSDLHIWASLIINFKLKSVGPIPWPSLVIHSLNSALTVHFMGIHPLHGAFIFSNILIFFIYFIQKCIYHFEDDRQSQLLRQSSGGCEIVFPPFTRGDPLIFAAVGTVIFYRLYIVL